MMKGGLGNLMRQAQQMQETMKKAQAAGVAVLVQPFTSDQRESAIVQFPGGYIAEIHATAK